MAKVCAPMKAKGKPDTDQDEKKPKGGKVTKAADFDSDEWLKGRKYAS